MVAGRGGMVGDKIDEEDGVGLYILINLCVRASSMRVGLLDAKVLASDGWADNNCSRLIGTFLCT